MGSMVLEKEHQQVRINAESNYGSGYLQKFRLYETRSNFYMIGRDKNRTCWKVLKINRLEQSELSVIEDTTTYSEIECYDLLKRIHEGNKFTGGLKFVTTCYGIVGFIKFLGPYYMLLITKRRKIGTICGHVVYSIAKSEMIPITNSTLHSNMAYSKNENRSFANSVCNVKSQCYNERTKPKTEYACYFFCFLIFRRKCSCACAISYSFLVLAFSPFLHSGGNFCDL